MDVSLPNVRMPLIDDQGCMTSPFYRYFQNANQSSGQSEAKIQSEIVQIATALGSPDGTVANIPDVNFNDFLSKSTTINGRDAISTSGSLSSGLVTISLLGDVETPPPLSFYGSMTGSRGWQQFTSNFANASGQLDLSKPGNSGAGTLQAVTVDVYGRITGTRAATIMGTAGRVTVANGDASAGLPTIDLATVADAGGGALLRFVRDAWGRISGTSAATTADLTEGINLYFTAARVLASILAGLSTATNAVITATDTVLSALGKLQAQITGNAAIPAGYIDGLKMVWNNATSISVTSGTCYIQGSSAVISFPSTLTLSGLSLSASTWYHLYGYLNSGTPAIELVTTVPAAAYSGTARSKTGDTSRRYVGSVLTDASSNVYSFLHSNANGEVLWQANIGPAPFVVVNGSSTTATNVNCSAVIGPTATIAKLFVANNDTARTVYLGNSNFPPSSSAFMAYVGISPDVYPIDVALDSSKQFQYLYVGGTPTANFVGRIQGYIYER